MARDSGGRRETETSERPSSYPNHRRSGPTADESAEDVAQTKDSSKSEIGAKTTGATAGAQTVRSASQKKNKDGLSTAGTNERTLSGNKQTSKE